MRPSSPAATFVLAKAIVDQAATIAGSPLVARRVCKRSTEATQAFGEHFRIHTHADAKVVGHFEEAARNRRCFEFRSQTFKENIGLSVPQSHE